MYKTTVLCMSLVFAGQAMAASDVTAGAEVVPASTFAEDTGDVIRIESAEYLRTYSQEVAAAACFLYNDIDPSFSGDLLKEARDGFDLRWNALVNGDPSLGIIGGEARRKTQMKLTAVGEVWQEMADAVDTLIADPSNSAAVDHIKANNLKLFDMTDLLVTHVSAQYSDPTIIMQVDALKLEIVGRQAMMTQKIAKDACKIFTGDDRQVLKDNLSRSMGIYEASLDALLNGLPELGILPAPTPEIAAALEAIQADWSETRPVLDTLVAGEMIDRDTQVFLFKHMVEEMVRLEDLSHSYVEFSRYSY